MADSTVGQEPVGIADDDDESMSPISKSLRKVGAEAAAEQRELLCMLLKNRDEMSGFAVRGLLMRVLDLSDATAELFEGTWSTPIEVISKVCGMTDEAFALAWPEGENHG